MNYHLVLVTKYRRSVIDDNISDFLKKIFEYIGEKYGIKLQEWNHDKDHIHVLFFAQPNPQLSKFINAYKSASSRLVKKKFSQIKSKLWKSVFLSKIYCLLTVGEAPLEVLKEYIKSQGEVVTYKFCIHPTKEQEEKLNKHFGYKRFVYNFFLNYATIIYKVMVRSTNYNEWAAILVKLKKMDKYSWLNEVNSQSLQQSLKHLDQAFKNFYKKRAGYPQFKKKKFPRQTFCVPQHIQLYIKEDNPKYGYIFVPKFKEGIKVCVHRKFPTEFKIKNVTFEKTPINKYYVSIVIEIPDTKITNTSDVVIGIDLGIKDTLTLITGEKYSLPDLSKYEKKLKRLHRQLSRKQKGAKNRKKARLRLAKVYEKITNIKNDWIHKVTHKIVNENQVGKIVVEDININGMLKNNRFSKYVHMQSWGTLITVLTYKAQKAGIELIKANRFFPSSQTCSVCGYVKKEVKDLKIRKWVCPIFGTEHDRDINAAKNLAKYGLTIPVGWEPSEFTPVDSALAAEPAKDLRASLVEAGSRDFYMHGSSQK